MEQEQQQNADSEQQQGSTIESPPNNEQSATTPNTPEAPKPVVDPAILAAYQEELLNKSRRNAELERQLAERNREPERELTPDDEKAYFEKPISTIKGLISEQLAAQVKPLNDFVNLQRRAQIIGTFKQQMAARPAQFPYIVQVEQIFDQIMMNEPTIDESSVVRAYNAALGYFISNGGNLNATPQTPPPETPNRTPTNVPTNPPHYKPAAPAPIDKGGNSKPKLRELTENEKKIARFNGMSDEEYIRLSELPPSKVASDRTPENK